MSKEELLKQKETYKRNVIILAVLFGVGLLSVFVLTIMFTYDVTNTMISLGFDANTITDEQVVQLIMDSFMGFFAATLVIGIATDICIPFLIINIVKLINRNKALNRLSKNESVEF